MPVEQEVDLAVAMVLDQPLQEVDERESVELRLEQLSAQRSVVWEIMLVPNRWPVISLIGVMPRGP